MLWWCLWTISSNHGFPLNVKLPLLLVVSFSLSLTSQNPGEFLSFDYFIIITNQRRLTRQASQWPVSHLWGHYRVCKCTRRLTEIRLYQTPHFLQKRKPDWQFRKVDIKCKSELPPANEVWGKVMFLHLCVMQFTGGGVSVPACITGHMTRGSLSGGISVQGGSLSGGSLSKGGLCPGGLCSGGFCPVRSQSRGVSVQGVSVWWGDFCLRVSSRGRKVFVREVSVQGEGGLPIR